MKVKLKSNSLGGGIFLLAIYFIILICWIINLFQLFNCDFEAPYKEEIIHGIGVVVPFASPVTIWF